MLLADGGSRHAETQVFRSSLPPESEETVRSFWQNRRAMSAMSGTNVIGATLNKLQRDDPHARRLRLIRPVRWGMREVLGRRRILLVLEQGPRGSGTAAMLGSMLVASLADAALQRSAWLPMSSRAVVGDYRRVPGGTAEGTSLIRMPIARPARLGGLSSVPPVLGPTAQPVQGGGTGERCANG